MHVEQRHGAPRGEGRSFVNSGDVQALYFVRNVLLHIL